MDSSRRPPPGITPPVRRVFRRRNVLTRGRRLHSRRMDREGGLASLVAAGSPILNFSLLTSLSRPFKIEPLNAGRLLRLTSADGMNRLTHSCMLALTETVRELASRDQPLIIAGNSEIFSVGADLHEISRLSPPAAYEFSKMGQTLMNEIEHFPAPVYAVVAGHCMRGGLDLPLACHRRIAAPHALFGLLG